MQLIEQFCISKREGTPCEDGWVLTPDYAAVVDGSTAKIPLAPDQESPGHLAMRLVIDAIRQLPADATLDEVLVRLSAPLARDTTYAATGYRPTCSAVIHSRHHEVVWIIGDCQCRINGQTYHPEKLVDQILTDMRCRAVHHFLAQGLSPDAIRHDDKGRAFIYDALRDQLHFQNDPNPYNPYRYTVIDGQPIDPATVTTLPVAGCESLILASDGYPVLHDSLNATETALHELLLADPLCIEANPATKCLIEGNRSFDDRTYLRYRISAT